MKRTGRIICLVMAIAMLLSVSAFAATTLTPAKTLPQNQPSKTFSDVSTSAWFYTNMNTIVKAGGIDGFPDGTFRPEAGLKLSEFVKILMSIMYPGQLSDWLDYKVDGQYQTWYSQFVGAAAHVGLLNGVTYTYAALEAPVNRYTMAVMMVNATKILGETLAINEDIKYLIFDYEIIPAQYRTAVEKAYTAGILKGVDGYGSFNGSQGLKRSEVCAVIARLYDISKRVPDTYFLAYEGSYVAVVKTPQSWSYRANSYYWTDSFGDDWFELYCASCETEYDEDGWLFSLVLCRDDGWDVDDYFVYVGNVAGRYVYLAYPDYTPYDTSDPIQAADYNEMHQDMIDGLVVYYVKPM